MSINLTDELIAKTKKGKLASAKQVFLDGDQENLQQVGEKTHQLEQSIKDIAASGGASVASAVTYDNATSGMTSVTAQGAIDELAAKDAAQDTEIAKKADSSDVESQMQTEQTRVNAELDKKFDKENVAQELGDAEDKVVSQYALPFRIEESPEWAYLIKDAEDHVLFGVQQDGSVEWQAGIPAPIRKRFEEIVSNASNDKSELSTKIDELNTSLSAEIQSLQDTKVDKEEGKSLIDDEVKQHFEVIENEEWLTLMTDAEDHILFGIKRDTGKPYFPLNEMYHVEQSPEFFALWKDAEGHILMGIRRDGEIVGEIHAVNALKQTIADIQSNIATLQSNVTSATDKINTVDKKVSTIDASLQELLNVFSLQENPEFLAVETDAEGKLLASTNTDGSHYAYNMKSETIPEEFSHIEDPEGRMAIETDAEQKILAYRDKEGVKHEHSMQVDSINATDLTINSLNLEGNSVDDIKTALQNSGFVIKTPIDWSDAASIYLPSQPRCALMNITGIDAMPVYKTQNLHAYAEVWDKNGNYFKKKVIVNAQGNSTMLMPKKNFALDFCEDDWKGDDTTDIKIGNWVTQDSFHFKAYYGGTFMMACPVAYKIFDKIYKTRDFCEQRPYMDYFANECAYNSNPISDMDKNMNIEPRCFPDGFPVIVYLNDKYYGVFSWQLKKHRDNFKMDRDEPLNIHLDGTISDNTSEYNTLWNGSIGWWAFEVRNPKPKSSKWKLLCQDGTVYNGDAPKELMGTDSEKYDASDISCKKSAQTKAAIVELSNYMAEIQVYEDAYNSAEDSNKATALASLKAEIEKRFGINYLIDYIIMINLVQNFDSIAKNWQWVTWGEINGKNRWYVMPYDWDGGYGIGGFNDFGIPYDYELGATSHSPAKLPWLYYRDDIKKRYAELRDKNVLSVDTVFGLIQDWISRVGYDNYVLEYKKWDETPCNRDSLISEDWEYTNKLYNTYSDSASNYSSTKSYAKDSFMKVNRRMYRSLQDNNIGHAYTETDWWEDMCVKAGTYNVGDTVYDGYSNFYQFKALKQITVDTELNGRPFKGFYNSYPREGGTHDSIYRIYKWIVRKFSKMDKQLEYTGN